MRPRTRAGALARLALLAAVATGVATGGETCGSKRKDVRADCYVCLHNCCFKTTTRDGARGCTETRDSAGRCTGCLLDDRPCRFAPSADGNTRCQDQKTVEHERETARRTNGRK